MTPREIVLDRKRPVGHKHRVLPTLYKSLYFLALIMGVTVLQGVERFKDGLPS